LERKKASAKILDDYDIIVYGGTVDFTDKETISHLVAFVKTEATDGV
jgi:hypothetical protein